jgi:hypothetical protein
MERKQFIYSKTLVIIILFFTLLPFIHTEEPLPVYYPVFESPDEIRQDYHYELIQIAFDKTIDSYVQAKLVPGRKIMNEWRQYKYLLHGEKGIDLMIKDNTFDSIINKHHKSITDQANIKKRTVMTLVNPFSYKEVMV